MRQISIGLRVEHPYKIGIDNKLLQGTITDLPGIYSNTPYWNIKWDGDEQSEVCECDDFKIIKL